MEQSQFSERLRQAMGKAHLKQADLVRMAAERGEKLGKSQLSQYVSGKVTPRREALGMLAGRTSLRPSLVSKFKFILRGSAL